MLIENDVFSLRRSLPVFFFTSFFYRFLMIGAHFSQTISVLAKLHLPFFADRVQEFERDEEDEEIEERAYQVIRDRLGGTPSFYPSRFFLHCYFFVCGLLHSFSCLVHLSSHSSFTSHLSIPSLSLLLINNQGRLTVVGVGGAPVSRTISGWLNRFISSFSILSFLLHHEEGEDLFSSPSLPALQLIHHLTISASPFLPFSLPFSLSPFLPFSLSPFLLSPLSPLLPSPLMLPFVFSQTKVYSIMQWKDTGRVRQAGFTPITSFIHMFR